MLVVVSSQSSKLRAFFGNYEEKLMSVIFAVCAWSLLVLSLYSVLQTLISGIKYVRKLHKIPCANCEYFTNDYRLKCTVNPTKACTEDAICCIDFAIKTSACNASQTGSRKRNIFVYSDVPK
jgi:hypothetical protein